jgi:hypothetical protein
MLHFWDIKSDLCKEGLLLIFRHVCKCWYREVHESVLQVHERVLEVQKWGALKTIPTLNDVAQWMVLATLSGAWNTGATLTSVRMTIYAMDYNMYNNSRYIRPPQTRGKKYVTPKLWWVENPDDRPRGIEILIADAVAKIKPTDPFKFANLGKHPGEGKKESNRGKASTYIFWLVIKTHEREWQEIS